MHRFFLLALTLLLVPSAFAALIPAQRLSTWIAGVDVGVEGGISQYRPGGASARTNELNVVSTYSADNTGATNAATAIQNAINAASTNDVVYLPVGVYKLTSGLTTAYKDNFTIRGAGQFTLSRSENSIGTGAKTFTVGEGLGYTAGCGVWVWVWDRNNIAIEEIERDGTTATVTTKFPHGFMTGQYVDMRGATASEYNGMVPITVTGTTTFTYTVSGSPISPAAGSWLFAKLCRDFTITSISRSGTTATVTTAAPHMLATSGNHIVTIRGADQSEYNIRALTTYVNSTQFTYQVAGSPANSSNAGIFGESAVDVFADNGPNLYMKGTCTSYSGGTLVLDIDSSQGEGSYAMWKVSLTVLDNHASAPAIYVGGESNGNFFQPLYWPVAAQAITDSPAVGATSFTVDDASYITIGDIAQIGIKNNYDATSGTAGDSAIVINLSGYEYNLRQMVKVTNKSGTTITVSPALKFALPVGREPRITSVATYASKVGVEDLAVFGHNSSYGLGLVYFQQAMDCWSYRVSVHSAEADFFTYSATLRQEQRECWSTFVRRTGTGGRGVGIFASSGTLVVDSVISNGSPCFEINQNCHYAVANNFIFSGDLYTNHGPHNKFAMIEGNVVSASISDGYFGGESEQTALRNWYYGYNYYYEGLWQLKYCRFSYNMNLVGNIFGAPDFIDSAVSLGLPNLGNQNSEGTAEATAAAYWRHLPSSSGPPTATLTTRTSDSAGVFTLDTLTAADYQAPYRYADGYLYMVMWWGDMEGATYRYNSLPTAFSGDDITFDPSSGPTVLPTDSPPTALQIWPQNTGFQEFDLDVEGTLVRKGNYNVSGSGGSQESLGGDTLPDSYVFASKPDSFGTLTWPAVDPASPNFSDGLAIIPASYWYFYGELPDAGSGTTYTPGRLRILRR